MRFLIIPGVITAFSVVVVWAALQLELSQRTDMNEPPPFEYRPDLAGSLIPVLQRLIEEVIAWTREHR